jgi:hypothetical protein
MRTAAEREHVKRANTALRERIRKESKAAKELIRHIKPVALLHPPRAKGWG